jgi:hypothetical protein
VNVLDLVTGAVFVYVGANLVVSVRRSWQPAARAHQLEIVRGLRLRHFLPVPLVFGLVVAIGSALIQLPGLSFGWWSAIGGSGNPVFGISDATSGTVLSTVLPLLFIVLLIASLPLLVEREERWFRLGSENRSMLARVWWAVAFGLVHALVGIPIGFALALSIGGAWFMIAYLRAWNRTHSQPAALLESTRCHLAYDLTIVALALGLAVTGNLGT